MLTGWFKCPVQAWQHVRWLIPKPWPPACMTADVRWWNDQLKMGWPGHTANLGRARRAVGRHGGRDRAGLRGGDRRGRAEGQTKRGQTLARAGHARSDRPDTRPD
jgi:hypothetical protein